MTSIKVNATLLRVAHMFASTEEARYYLCGVYIHKHQAKGVTLAATNGHMMFVAHDPEGHIDGDGRIIRLDKPALAACKAGRREIDPRVIEISDDGIATITAENHRVGVFDCKIVDGTYPDYQRVIPTTPANGERAAFSGRYLSNFAKAAAELHDNRDAPVCVRYNGGDPAIVDLFAENAFGVIMPMRTATPASSDRLPDFFTALPSQKAAA